MKKASCFIHRTFPLCALQSYTYGMSYSEFVFDMCLFCVVRNKDLTWPEEMCQLAKNRASIIRSKQSESSTIVLVTLSVPLFQVTGGSIRCFPRKSRWRLIK